MRLWHYKLIPVLPRQQLLGQWRECCLIAKNIAESGTPNHILVDPVMEYSSDEFLRYCRLIVEEMRRRGYFVNEQALLKHIRYGEEKWKLRMPQGELTMFSNWHTPSYLMQCYYNLQEKYDRGGISNEEWQKIETAVGGEVK